MCVCLLPMKHVLLSLSPPPPKTGRGQIFATSLDPSEISANVVPSTPGGSAEVTPELGMHVVITSGVVIK